jgi:hypothetical protein
LTNLPQTFYFKHVHPQTAAPQGKVRQDNLATTRRLARQDRPDALKFQSVQYGDTEPEVTIEWRVSFKLPRHARWRDKGYMVTSLEQNLVASSAVPHRMAWVANVAAPLRMVRQFDVAALLASGLGLCATILDALKLKRGRAILPRHRAWRCSVMLPRRHGWRGKPG